MDAKAIARRVLLRVLADVIEMLAAELKKTGGSSYTLILLARDAAIGLRDLEGMGPETE